MFSNIACCNYFLEPLIKNHNRILTENIFVFPLDVLTDSKHSLVSVPSSKEFKKKIYRHPCLRSLQLESSHIAHSLMLKARKKKELS